MRYPWAPAVILVVGAVLTFGVGRQRVLSLEKPLHTVIPGEILTYVGQDLAVTEGEARVAGFSNHLLRVYEAPDTTLVPVPWFSLYVGYYESQTRGQTIHSPRNCLPGAGWEAVSSQPRTLSMDGETVTVNQYLLANEGEQALVLYWYQGRGRVAHNEYRVKVDLLLDAALRRRSDEALVRIVIPWTGDDPAAQELVAEVARTVIPRIEEALPD